MHCKSYEISRRHFLGAGIAGMATLMGMNVRDLIAASNAATSDGRHADHVILLWMSGGMSHIDTFDPKPGRPTAGEFEPIKTAVDGIDIAEIFPGIAAQMRHAALIRSIAGTEGDHGRARYNVMTGYTMTPQMIHPGLGSIVSHQVDALNELPSFVSIGGRASAAGYLGQKYDAYYIGRPGEPDPYMQLPEDLPHHAAEKRMQLLAHMNQQYTRRVDDETLRDTQGAYAAAERFMASPALKAFDIDNEDPAVREAYGDTGFGRGCLLARRLVESGVRFVQVSLGGFDTHSNNFPAMRNLGETMDPAISSLISDLNGSGMLKRTMVIVLSEFGRTPRVNGAAGRDHHPRVFSALMAGGGVNAGTVIGASDEDGYEPRDQPVRVGDIHATVCKSLGISPTKQLKTPLGRPMRIVEEGEAIEGLLTA